LFQSPCRRVADFSIGKIIWKSADSLDTPFNEPKLPQFAESTLNIPAKHQASHSFFGAVSASHADKRSGDISMFLSHADRFIDPRIQIGHVHGRALRAGNPISKTGSVAMNEQPAYRRRFPFGSL
jgi:hypothetical protein